MPKQVIISMDQYYPFGECQQCTNDKTRVLVRKIYHVSLQERNKLLEKVNILRRLKNEHMIKIESVLEEEQSIHFLFEYIPIKVQTWISNINDQFIENFRDQLIKFSSFLANNSIKVEFQLKNIGMDHNYNAKYFLDLNFELNPNLNREKLKSNYIREITNLFKPYLANSSIMQVNDSDREKKSYDFKTQETGSKGNQTARRQDSAISPPTNKSNPKNKEKALERYYQQVNMSVDSQNQKILQQFMDVLDNDEEAQHIAAKPSHTVAHNMKPTQNNYEDHPSQQFYSQKEYPPANQNSSYSEKQIISQTSNSQQPNNSPSKSQNQGFRPLNPFTRSSARGKGDLIDTNEFMRESIELQNRVKSAIQKSMSAIKKFREIREHIQN